MTTKITDKNISVIANMGVDWQSVITSDGSTVTQLSAGKGYFIDNTSAAGLVKLPAVDDSNAGDTIMIKDYASSFGTNKLTVQRNGHKIQGFELDQEIITNKASVTLVYVDTTKGWVYSNEANVADLRATSFISATGGTVTTDGNFKIHSFTGDGCFVVACIGTGSAPNVVDYLVVAGGGSGGYGNANDGAGGGGAGGYRESAGCQSGSYCRSPLGACVSGITATATTFPITVGAGGAAATSGCNMGNKGSNSIFSTITSAGGGGGDANGNSSPTFTGSSGRGAGGSGGGGHQNSGGTGNTPPVSPAQGTNGGSSTEPSGAGGGGAATAGANHQPNNGGGPGGNGQPSGITGSDVTRAGGGAGANSPGRPSPVSPTGNGGPGGGGGAGGSGATGCAGTANTGGGGGASSGSNSGAGGKGVVILRYKFQ